ncbi:MAG: phosphoribosylamine--glycine ligase [Rhodospirillaceae bacterium]|nr:phosphoribosylamine--glycine ligase [Rhodospirillaceae bacterium]|tara:strand:+ start:918 stop:2189 length:1272 start_codon:yes stop_codon:yes gene_type:complete
MRILVIGSGGREHALCWAIANSPLVTKLYCAPGNAGIEAEAEPVDLKAEDIEGLVAWARDNAIDFVVPGPEAPLVVGIVDTMEAAGIACWGPSAGAAMLEGSKTFTKEVSDAAGVPTAAWQRFTDASEARAYIDQQGAPIVVKADGLAAGKGVTVAMTKAEAYAAIDDALVSNIFGEAGASVVIEEFMEGEEASFHVLTDGESVLPLATAQDHKRVGDGDTGPNTGGMGCYSPAPVLTPEMEEIVLERIVHPTVAEMKRRGTPFKGVLYAGLMITADGPKLVEYNVRFGDPECQVMLSRLKSDLLPALLACRDGELHHLNLRWHDKAALCVVMATEGYPGSYLKDTQIEGLEAAGDDEAVTVFHAGTRREGETWLSTGGRVLGVTALGDTIADAQTRAYAAVDRLDWPQGFCRRDIGWRAVGQ